MFIIFTPIIYILYLILQSIHTKVFDNLDKGTIVNGVIGKAKEVRRTMAVRTAKAVDTPLGSRVDSLSQFMF